MSAPGEALGWGVAALAAAYLISGVPFGLLVLRLSGGGDIRERGSGNIGATNAFRAGGRWVGTVTLLLDIGKGALSVALAGWLTGGQAGWQSAAALAAVVGHCFPVYLRFRGGKGIATGCGAFGVLAPVPMAVALAVFLTAMGLTRMVSVGSIAAGLALPLLLLWLRPEPALLIAALGAVLVVLARHHANIRRIVTGEEHRIDGA